MDIDLACHVARHPTDYLRADLAIALDLLVRDRDAREALVLEQQRLVTLGGIPKPSTTNWANRRTVIDPVHPDYIELAKKTR
jgi:hypothetical protein